MSNRYPGGLIRKTTANTSLSGATGVWSLEQAAQAQKTDNWPISGLANPISKSLRFRSSNSAYLTRTAGSPTNANKWTWSGWVKRGTLGANAALFGAWRSSQCVVQCYFQTNNTLRVYLSNGDNSTYLDYQTSQVFRDPSAWYHIVVSVDNTLSTTSVIIYVNGVQITSYGTSSNILTQNVGLPFNYSGTAIYMGQNRDTGNSAYGYYDGHMAEINFVDGQVLTPSYFGQTSAITGVWEPIKYTGTYGNNGFYMTFSDSSSIGKDLSGNGNNWASSGISTASDYTYDLMSDVPTQWIPSAGTDTGGTVRGNYATLNAAAPGDYFASGQSSLTLTNGNLNYGSGGRNAFGNVAVSSGKWYWEALNTTNTSSGVPLFGLVTVAARASVYGVYYNASNGYKGLGTLNSGASETSYGATWTDNDLIGVALDMDAATPTVTFYKNNSSQGTISVSSFVGQSVMLWIQNGANSGNMSGWVNFGQRPFTYTPPSGYKSLCTTNLPTPTIGATTATAANKYMDATTYTGNGSSLAVTNAGSFKPDFVWVKDRQNAYHHALFDSVRGVTKSMQSDSTEADRTGTALTSFNSNGFTLGLDTSQARSNDNGVSYIGWQWQAGQGTTSSNTSGSITSTVSVNATAGFSIVSYTGTGSSATVGHGLGVTPAMIIIKNRVDASASWPVWHKSISSNQLYLNLTNALDTPDISSVGSSTFSVDTWTGVNGSGNAMIAYCWAEIAGYSKFGSYTGNGSTDGPFLYFGFRPKFVIVKRTDTAGLRWEMFDSSRFTYNGMNNPTLYPNESDAEHNDAENYGDFLSNGFKLRYTNGNFNASGGTYIYMAFAENPFKTALAR